MLVEVGPPLVEVEVRVVGKRVVGERVVVRGRVVGPRVVERAWCGCRGCGRRGWVGSVVGAVDQVPGDVAAVLVGGGGDVCPEASSVDGGVVALAEECGVGGVGGAVVGPVADVVGSGPRGGCGAAGPGAAAVAEPEVAALGAGEEAGDPPEGEGFVLGAEDVGDERGVAGEAAEGVGGQEGAVGDGAEDLAGAGAGAEVGQGDGDVQGVAPRRRCRWPASIPLAAWQTWVRASTRRCPAGRRSASPVSGLGAGAVRGPMAASRVAAWSGVIHSWYSVRSPDSRCGIDRRAAAVSRCCRSSRAPWWPWSASSRGRSRRISEGPHCWARSTSAVVTVGTVSGRSSGTSRALSRSTEVAVEASRAPEATWDQTTPTGDCGSGPSEASSPDPDLAPATSCASRATDAAPPCRSDGACSRTHAWTSPTGALTAADRLHRHRRPTRRRPRRDAVEVNPISSASPGPDASCSTSPSPTSASRAASRRERRSARVRGPPGPCSIISNRRTIDKRFPARDSPRVRAAAGRVRGPRPLSPPGSIRDAPRAAAGWCRSRTAHAPAGPGCSPAAGEHRRPRA